jgi:hypothetical protein
LLELTIPGEPIEIDLGRLDWYADFYARHAADGRIDPRRALTWTTVSDASEVPGQATGHPLSEASYWELFLAGYARYRRSGTVSRRDPYARYLLGPFREGHYDPDLSPLLVSPDAAVDRVHRRYEDVDRLAAADPAAGTRTGIDPVRLVASVEGTEEDFTVPVIGRDDLIVRVFDGYHRAFAAQLLGFSSLECRAHVMEADAATYASGGVA